MSLLDEPKNQPGTAQIITDEVETDGKKQTSRVWMQSTDAQPVTRFLDSTTQAVALPVGAVPLVSDCITWLAASALVMKLSRGIGYLAAIGTLNTGAAMMGVCLIWLALAAAAVYAYNSLPSLRVLISYRLFLVVLGICLGTIV